MEVALREKPSRESDPRWMNTPPDPIAAFIFPFFHIELDHKHHPGQTRVRMLMTGKYMGQVLVVPVVDRADEVIDQEGFVEATFDLTNNIAH